MTCCPPERRAGAADPEGDLASQVRCDADDLRRGAVANLVGYGLRFTYPALVWLVVSLYGRETFGSFVAAEAALLLVLRVSLLGLDKGILWWVPRQTSGQAERGLVTALTMVGASSGAAALAVAALLAPVLAHWQGDPAAAGGLQLMAAALVPMALTEVLIAALARRRIGAQVLAKEGVASVTMVATAVAFHLAGLGPVGLPAAFGLSRLAVLAAAVGLCRGVFAPPTGRPSLAALPADLRRYAAPYWLAEVANSALLRLDVLLLAVLSDPGTVGLYAVVSQLANALRSVRRTFDPLALAVFSHIGVAHSVERLRAGVSRATALVLATQLPVFAVLVVGAPWALAWLGPGFAAGAPAAHVLCAFWLANGLLGLCGTVVSGYGRSDLALANALGGLAVQGVLMLWLVPGHGLMGAVVAVGVSQLLLGGAQLAEAAWVTGTWVYGRDVGAVLALGGAAGLAMAVGWWAASGWGGVASRLAGLALFAAVFGSGLLWARGSRAVCIPEARR